MAMRTLIVLAWFTLAVPALAQSTGTLTGRVVDVETGEEMPSATVILEGLPIGAAADLNGEYRIIGVPAGTHSISARFVGYASETTHRVKVLANGFAEASFALREIDESDFGKPGVEKFITIRCSLGGVPRVVMGEAIESLPVRGVQFVEQLAKPVIPAKPGTHSAG